MSRSFQTNPGPRPSEIMIYPPGEDPVRHLLVGELVTMGRSADCTIPIRDRFLSRKHAEIVQVNGAWHLRDCGSANGTFINGSRLSGEVLLRPGDRVVLGDSEIVFEGTGTDKLVSVDTDTGQTSSLSMDLAEAVREEVRSDKALERARIVNELAIELIEDRPMTELFEHIIDRVFRLLFPSTAAIALLSEDRKSFETVRVRRSDAYDNSELVMSSTLLDEVVEKKRVVSILDVGLDEKLAQAKSIVAQNIRSALCAPLMVGNSVLGVLYSDFMIGLKNVGEDDIKLFAQIARFAAAKLETTRLREQAVAKQKIEEELRMAYVIQSRLLPGEPPKIDGYEVAGSNRPARMVSGDYYDFVVRPDGRVYFVIADVSGKGITAALIMSSLATAFAIFTRTDPTPGRLLAELNRTLQPNLSPSKFVTMVAGVLDPSRPGVIDFANAGHTPPMIIRKGGVEMRKETNMVVGLFAAAQYQELTLELAPEESLILFTDGITEAENMEEEEFGLERLVELLTPLHASNCREIAAALENRIKQWTTGHPQTDDVTVLTVKRTG